MIIGGSGFLIGEILGYSGGGGATLGVVFLTGGGVNFLYRGVFLLSSCILRKGLFLRAPNLTPSNSLLVPARGRTAKGDRSFCSRSAVVL